MITSQQSKPGGPPAAGTDETRVVVGLEAVSYTHLTLPTNREV